MLEKKMLGQEKMSPKVLGFMAIRNEQRDLNLSIITSVWILVVLDYYCALTGKYRIVPDGFCVLP